MGKNGFIKVLKKTWHFIWEEDSLASWIVNIILAIVLIKFVIYPGLGLALGTSFPIVAVVSDSMEHNSDFESWWQMQSNFYLNRNITAQDFQQFPFKNGFNKGDLMVLVNAKPPQIKTGDVIVFMAGRPDPIIHRVVEIKNNEGAFVFQTKGDHNQQQIVSSWLDETNIAQNGIVGKAVLRVPYLGWVKIGAVEIFAAVINFFR